MEFSRFIGGFGINQIFYKKFQYLNFKKSNKNSGNSAVAIVNKAQLSCKQTNIEKSRIRNKSGIFTIIMFFLDIVQNDWTRIDEDYSCKFQGKKQNEDWPGWSGFGRFCDHKILIRPFHTSSDLPGDLTTSSCGQISWWKIFLDLYIGSYSSTRPA